MRAHFTLLSLTLSVTLCASALADGPTKVESKRDRSWNADHPIAIGGRASAWIGQYSAPGLGGHVKIRPWDWLGVEAFSDNFAWVQDQAFRHDHVIGFSLYAPSLIGGESWFIAPTLGACVDFRFAHPTEGDIPSASSILFGVHGGLMAEVFLDYGFSFEANATLYGYVGHETEIDRWSATVSNDLGFAPLFLVSGSVNYYF